MVSRCICEIARSGVLIFSGCPKPFSYKIMVELCLFRCMAFDFEVVSAVLGQSGYLMKVKRAFVLDNWM